MNYQIIFAEDIFQLTRRVQSCLDENLGWKPIGGPVLTSKPDDLMLNKFAQAMIQEVKPDADEKMYKVVKVDFKLSAKDREMLNAYLDHLNISMETLVRKLVQNELAEERLNYGEQ